MEDGIGKKVGSLRENEGIFMIDNEEGKKEKEDGVGGGDIVKDSVFVGLDMKKEGKKLRINDEDWRGIKKKLMVEDIM